MRWDTDSASTPKMHYDILQRFIDGEADVVIGTQMIAKGLDLPLVTLVGVVSADLGLALPDYRAGERVFQLLTQVAGRAGRGVLGRQGRVADLSAGATMLSRRHPVTIMMPSSRLS